MPTTSRPNPYKPARTVLHTGRGRFAVLHPVLYAQAAAGAFAALAPAGLPMRGGKT